ncbi:Yip1 domain protein [Andreesenia angusta]|uniref:Yip1 domain protein n=1 Tax=Andreesenia angusta TaxID=39480 RepID=A0A1S1V9J2_9FIRM|nr:hypothetical protein [Andreesenia angusta]OHW63258.1 Yip1 domain protein [Andreesenia angusta]
MQSRVEALKKSGFKSIFMIMVNPGGFLKNHLKQFHWAVGLTISALAFMLFFLQTGLDMNRAGKLSTGGLLIFMALGLLYGTGGIALLSLLANAISKSYGGDKDYAWTVKAFGLGYTPTLVYVILGIAFNLLAGWNTSIAFGVTGVLWALNPMIHSIKELTSGNLTVSLMLTTALGSITLLGWGLLSLFGS